MDDTIINLKKQHIENYRRAILENIKNNTKVLADDDIMSLLRKPPLDSMDLIKTKFLDLAKKNKIVLNMDNLSKIMDEYRKDVIKCCSEIKNIRIEILSEKVKNVAIDNDSDTIKINKKDFTGLNKQIKKILKDQLLSSMNKVILKKIDTIFKVDEDSVIKDKIITDATKYIKGSYQKQLMENFDIKVLVKDTTLISGVKEQSERYLFTLNNSRLLNDNLDS